MEKVKEVIKLKNYSFLNINKNLTENDIDNIDIRSQLEHQIQIHETKESRSIFDKRNSIKIGYYKTGELNSSRYI